MSYDTCCDECGSDTEDGVCLDCGHVAPEADEWDEDDGADDLDGDDTTEDAKLEAALAMFEAGR